MGWRIISEYDDDLRHAHILNMKDFNVALAADTCVMLSIDEVYERCRTQSATHQFDPDGFWLWLRQGLLAGKIRPAGPAEARKLLAQPWLPDSLDASSEVYAALKAVSFFEAEVMALLPDLTRVLEGVRPAQAEGEAPVRGRQNKRGAPRKYRWDEAGAAFGAWLHDQPGRAEIGFREHLGVIQAIMHALGDETPDEESIRRYWRRWVDGFTTFSKIEL
jgi:hypothetical protein